MKNQHRNYGKHWLIAALLVTLITVYSLSSCSTTIDYDGNTLQDYAHGQYAEIFASAGGVEDNILIVFITDEDGASYHYTVVVGDHVMDDIYEAFCGNEQNDLDRAMSAGMSQSYEHTLDRNLCKVVDTVTNAVGHRASRFSVWCEESNMGVESRLINQTDLSINEDMVNSSLSALSENAGVPVVLLVEDSRDVFDTKFDFTLFFPYAMLGLVFLVVAVVAVITVITVIKKRKNCFRARKTQQIK